MDYLKQVGKTFLLGIIPFFCLASFINLISNFFNPYYNLQPQTILGWFIVGLLIDLPYSFSYPLFKMLGNFFHYPDYKD